MANCPKCGTLKVKKRTCYRCGPLDRMNNAKREERLNRFETEHLAGGHNGERQDQSDMVPAR